MVTQAPQDLEFSDAWIESDERGRWRSAPGPGPGARASSSGSSLLEIEPGCILPRHTDSAEEVIVVVSGSAKVIVEDDAAAAPENSATVVPTGTPHEVHNAGDRPLRFWAVYAAPEVTTTYAEPVQPDGERERSPVRA